MPGAKQPPAIETQALNSFVMTSWDHVSHDTLEALNKAPNLMESVLTLLVMVYVQEPHNRNVHTVAAPLGTPLEQLFVETWDGERWCLADGMTVAEILKYRILEHMEQHPAEKGQMRRYSKRDADRLYVFCDSASKLDQPTLDLLLHLDRHTRRPGFFPTAQ
jgi:hypothetical protein